MDLADDPFLDAVDKLGGGDFGRSSVHEPGVCEATASLEGVYRELRRVLTGPLTWLGKSSHCR